MKKYIFLVLTLLWMSIIFMFSAKTSDASGADSMFFTERIVRLFVAEPSPVLLDIFETVFRKICHFAEYALLAVLWYITLRCFGLSSKWSLISVGICMVYAVTDEIHQYFVPGRACRIYDIAIDTLGSAVGCAISYGIDRIKRKK